MTAVATDDVWAVGNSYFGGLQRSVVEHWDGENWTVVPSPNDGPFLNWFVSISATSADDIWAVGQHRAVFGTSQVYQTSSPALGGRGVERCPQPERDPAQQLPFRRRRPFGDGRLGGRLLRHRYGARDVGSALGRPGVEHRAEPNGAGGYISELNAVAAVTPTNVWAAGQAFDGFFDFETFFQEYGCDESDPGPTLQTITPASGPASAGTAVHVTGSNLVSPLTLMIGGALASDVVVNGFESIDATTPDLAPGTLNDIQVTIFDNQIAVLPAGFFADFLDVPQADLFHADVEKLIRHGVTAGCGAGLFCRDGAVTRAQMAVFLLKAKLGEDHMPPSCTGTVFDDVPCSGGVFDPWIEELSGLAVTSGCQASPPLYCPNDPVNRQQMAVFLLKTKNGGFSIRPTAPACSTTSRARPASGSPTGSSALRRRGHRRLLGLAASLLPDESQHPGPDGGLPHKTSPCSEDCGTLALFELPLACGQRCLLP